MTNVTYYQPTFLMNLANVLAMIVSVYSLLIWLRIMLTWIRIPGSQWDSNGNPIIRFLSKIVDPYLNLFRGISPLRRSRVDFTPIVAVAVLSIVQSLLEIYGMYGKITLGLVLGLIVRTLWIYIFSMFFVFFIILLVVRLVFCFRRSPRSVVYIQMLDSILGGFINWIQKVFFRNKPTNDRNLVIVALVVTVVGYILCTLLVNWIVALLGRIPV